MYSIKEINSFELENGQVIDKLTVGYHSYGKLNKDKSNVIWVCHALTANSDVTDWWSGLFGKNKFYDPEKYFIICANSLGSCYGTTGPASSDGSNQPLLNKFPNITTRDIARAHDALRRSLQLDSIHLLIGASLGGQQAIEWSILNPNIFENLILLATNARHSAYGIAFNESQRLAIYADSTYGTGIDGGRKGLIAARSIALLSYRSYQGYEKTQTDQNSDKSKEFHACSYQNYQGEKLANRFDAYSYVTLSKAMDSHNVGRWRKSIKDALQQIKAKTLVIGISTDQLFPTKEQKLISRNIPYAEYAEVFSEFGHDGFLIETEKIAHLMDDFLHHNFTGNKQTTFKRVAKNDRQIKTVEI